MTLQLVKGWPVLRTRRSHALEQLSEAGAQLDAVLGGPLVLPYRPELLALAVDL